jgi:hypothetical protein
MFGNFRSVTTGDGSGAASRASYTIFQNSRVALSAFDITDVISM